MHTPVMLLLGKIFPEDAYVWTCTSREESTEKNRRRRIEIGEDSHVLRGFLGEWGE